MQNKLIMRQSPMSMYSLIPPDSRLRLKVHCNFGRTCPKADVVRCSILKVTAEGVACQAAALAWAYPWAVLV